MASSISSRLIAALALAIVPGSGRADPLRLRGDALATLEAPAGLMSLEASDRARPWLDAEASVWFGAGDDAEADALVIVVKVRDPKRRGSARIGRQVVTAGALRPVHLDGAEALVRWRRSSLELFGGIPVVPTGTAWAFDWVAGARAAQRIGDGQIGLAWLQQRDHDDLATHELAADAGFPIGRRVDVGAGAAIDLIDPGIAELRLSAAWRGKTKRGELFATRRSPSHLMPATSLFSVLGDVPATRAGLTGRWQAAPRLDVDATVAVRIADTEPTSSAGALPIDVTPIGASVREDASIGARLWLDDRGRSSVGLELRRQGAPDGGWTGARGRGRLHLTEHWATSAELELVVPDEDRGRGDLWPWALGAVTWRPSSCWELAAAIEGSATAQYSSRVDVLIRLSRSWDPGAGTATHARSGALAKAGVP